MGRGTGDLQLGPTSLNVQRRLHNNTQSSLLHEEVGYIILYVYIVNMQTLNNIFISSTTAGEEHRVVTVLNENDCFVSKGGILHIFGATWYELQNVQNQVSVLSRAPRERGELTILSPEKKLVSSIKTI